MERTWNINERVRATDQVLVKENNLRSHSFNQSIPLFISRTDSMNLQSQDILLSMKPKASKLNYSNTHLHLLKKEQVGQIVCFN